MKIGITEGNGEAFKVRGTRITEGFKEELLLPLSSLKPSALPSVILAPCTLYRVFVSQSAIYNLQSLLPSG
jgi:hypothetical protein